ncbi:hypothetical protein FO519_004005 [Halicephalobus sp. NKZ332]|nr:hypothetical protein FO519_004005 [Halicephalobus sp. NKZ332]
MVYLCLVFFFFSAFQVSFSKKFFPFYVSEVNGKSYAVQQFHNSSRLELVTVESGGVIRRFELPNCDLLTLTSDSPMSILGVKIQQDSLLLHIKNLEDNNQYLEIVNLLDLSNNIVNTTCLYVDDVYFGKHKNYIYKVEEGRILKRWLVTSDGKEANPTVVAETKFPIKTIDVRWQNIRITTQNQSINRGSVVEFHPDVPRCDVPESNTSCEENDLGRRKVVETALMLEKYIVVVIVVAAVFLFLLILAGSECCLFRWGLGLGKTKQVTFYRYFSYYSLDGDDELYDNDYEMSKAPRFPSVPKEMSFEKQTCEKMIQTDFANSE